MPGLFLLDGGHRGVHGEDGFERPPLAPLFQRDTPQRKEQHQLLHRGKGRSARGDGEEGVGHRGQHAHGEQGIEIKAQLQRLVDAPEEDLGGEEALQKQQRQHGDGEPPQVFPQVEAAQGEASQHQKSRRDKGQADGRGQADAQGTGLGIVGAGVLGGGVDHLGLVALFRPCFGAGGALCFRLELFAALFLALDGAALLLLGRRRLLGHLHRRGGGGRLLLLGGGDKAEADGVAGEVGELDARGLGLRRRLLHHGRQGGLGLFLGLRLPRGFRFRRRLRLGLRRRGPGAEFPHDVL